MANFYEALVRTLNFEGGYGDEETDRGKETYRGITRRSNPEWSGWAIVDLLKTNSDFPNCLDRDSILQGEVESFYMSLWNSLRLQQVRSQSLSNAIFDFAVNSGQTCAIKFLQRVLNLRSMNGKRWEVLDVDGVMGSKTFASLSTMATKYSSDAELLTSMLNCWRGVYCMEFAERVPDQVVNIHSWFSRI